MKYSNTDSLYIKEIAQQTHPETQGYVISWKFDSGSVLPEHLHDLDAPKNEKEFWLKGL